VANPKITILGPLPVDLISRTLDLDWDMEAGDAILTAQAKKHIADRHSEDFAIVMRYLDVVIENPTYIGQSPHHADAFEMVRRITVEGGTEVILAAVSLKRNGFGNYSVHSAYCLKEETVTARVQRGHLLAPKRKAPG
jgi:hypothetical protein